MTSKVVTQQQSWSKGWVPLLVRASTSACKQSFYWLGYPGTSPSSDTKCNLREVYHG